MKQKVMLFAGTTEGRLLYEFLEAEGFKAMVFVTTAMGNSSFPMGKRKQAAQPDSHRMPGPGRNGRTDEGICSGAGD